MELLKEKEKEITDGSLRNINLQDMETVQLTRNLSKVILMKTFIN